MSFLDKFFNKKPDTANKQQVNPSNQSTPPKGNLAISKEDYHPPKGTLRIINESGDEKNKK